MISKNEIAFIKKEIFDLTLCKYAGEVYVEFGDKLSVNATANRADIICPDKAALARCFFLIAMEYAKGNENICINQKRHFEVLGTMSELDRMVLTVESVKNHIRHIAAVGMNTILLYIEDCYELEGYPYFGHMRGRYTLEELKEIDDYGYSMGVEVIPCIQTLAHLESYLRWGEARAFRDTMESVMVDCEETYEFIDAILKTCKNTFRTNKIHLGMDEARQLGLGNYFIKNGFHEKHELFAHHLTRVKNMCFDYQLEPKIWSDMIFKSCGGYDDEYSKKAVITDEVIEALKGVEAMYWDYYKDNKEAYIDIMERHNKVCDNVSFAGGIWNWDGFLTNYEYTFRTMKPAMEACLDCKVSDVYATMWTYADTIEVHCYSTLAIFSEYCYRGYACTDKDIFDVGEFLSGHPKALTDACAELFMGKNGSVSIGPRVINCDLFYEMMRYPMDYAEVAKAFDVTAKKIEEFKGCELADYAYVVLTTARNKAQLFEVLRPAYKNKDMAKLSEIYQKTMPEIIEMYKSLMKNVVGLWLKYAKPFGVEELQFRFAGFIHRLEYQMDKIRRYCTGDIDVIEELEEEVLRSERATWVPWRAHNFTRITQ